ncbi:MAG: hypothetical protein CMB06_04365 [Euryarchaeota archaeon]|nr:hypothetical protein [Euryarchaeota archaeon]
MTIVSFQLDSDEDNIWIYLYSIPRVKMGNLTITIGEDNETLSSVFSHQKHILVKDMENITDDEGYFSLYLAADLREVKWEYECKIQVIKEEDIDQYEFTAEVLVGQGDDEVELTWSLPHNKVLEFKK